MAIWSGYGFVTAATFALGLLLAPLVGPLIGIEDNLRVACGLLAAAVANWVIGRWFNDPAAARVRVDPATGRLRLEANRHALLNLPMQYWSPIGVVLVLAVLIVGGPA